MEIKWDKKAPAPTPENEALAVQKREAQLRLNELRDQILDKIVPTAAVLSPAERLEWIRTRALFKGEGT